MHKLQAKKLLFNKFSKNSRIFQLKMRQEIKKLSQEPGSRHKPPINLIKSKNGNLFGTLPKGAITVFFKKRDQETEITKLQKLLSTATTKIMKTALRYQNVQWIYLNYPSNLISRRN